MDSFPSHTMSSHESMRQVLLRLPVKSLLHFKCASKEWYDYITDPIFMKEHMQLASEGDEKLLIHRSETTGNANHNTFFILQPNTKTREMVEPPHFMSYTLNDDVVDLCDGVILIHSKHPIYGIHQHICQEEFMDYYSICFQHEY